MNKRAIAKILALVCAAACAFVALTGCWNSGNDAAAEAQKANRAYMSQVNEDMVQLRESLDSFVDAVSRDDIVNMRTQAAKAYKVLDKLTAIEPPEQMAEIHEHYVAGANKLREALDAYIDLYAELHNSSEDNAMSKATYDKRIAAIQDLYDEGVAELQAGDELAAAEG